MNTRKMFKHLAIIAIYVALTLALGNLSFSMIQVRLSEVMMVFCCVKKEYIYSLTLACLFSNLLGVMLGLNAFVLDIIIGTLATFVACYLVYIFRNIKWFNKPILSLLMPVIINALFVGYEISFYMNAMQTLILNMLYVGIGEFVSCFVLGTILYEPLCRLLEKDEL